ncbi:MAG: glutamate-1-semialdehyde 2,1-aminomutase [Planctomycetota bacterium]
MIPRNDSAAFFARALRVMPGGVSSPVRAFRAVGGEPLVFERGVGAYVQVVGGQCWIDLCGSWGVGILGHAPEEVVAAVQETAARGLSFGAPCVPEVELAEAIVERLPHVEKVRFVSSGTEAVMSAVRLARGFTRRNLIVKFEGCYHGHSDALLVKGGSGLATFGNPSSAGVPASAVADTVVLPLDDEGAVDELFQGRGASIAAVVIEPVPANAGLLLQRREYLHALQRSCREAGALLILDEVISGFRVGPRGAAGLYDLEPDLTTLGKIVGGGMPLAAFGGKAEIFECLAPQGPVYQAGTLSGNPVATAAGLATLRALDRPGLYEELERRGARLEAGLRAACTRHGIEATVVRLGSVFWLVFQAPAPRAFHAIEPEGIERFATFHKACLEKGLYWPPSGYEVAFLSVAHGEEVVREVVRIVDESLGELAGAA